ncbi:MAG: 23S rRNA (pseudouridine(1915)-N(3))-methyltransferase RlmH [Dysgonomonas sp.]|nr:23S rRNA (pseudouridine(1915)-N(3))-methyltransferase RlmH [Dysgonomonas sp.]
MKISLILVGRTDAQYFIDSVQEYESRLKHYIPFEIQILPDLKNTKNLTIELQKEKEGELIIKSLQPGDFVVLLDERGKEFTSLQFASFIEKKTYTVNKRLIFIVGGAYGFSEQVYKKAAEKISLSKMTFSHQMIRLIFVEQLYRAMTILNNEPYHHE